MVHGLVTFKTQIGWMGLQGDGKRILRTAMGNRYRKDLIARFAEFLDDSVPLLSADACPQLAERFQKFFSGQKVSLSHLRIDESWMTPFQKRVVEACRAIPWGETLTYGQLAQVAGNPGASRAVGSVMSKNRFPIIVPCHRVCSSSGLGGFSAPNGTQLKTILLENEGHQLTKGAKR